MVLSSKRHQIDMTSGAVLPKLLKFATPLIFSNLLQVLFHLADTLVLGACSLDGAVGAVGSTSSLINLMLGLFVGLSMGANVVVAKNIGAKKEEEVKQTIGMSILLSLIAGIFLLVIGLLFSKTFLIWMDCQPSRLADATSYMKIYFLGIPFSLLYNFSASVMRASGDSLRPTMYITIGGVMNVLFNILFVAGFGMGVEGVAIATIISQAFAGICCFVTLITSKTNICFRWKYFRIFKKQFKELIRIGLPSGIQGCLFSLSNVIIQSSINSFGDVVMDGSGYATHFDNIVYTVQNAIALSAMSFISQNVGARNIKRVKSTTLISGATVMVVGISLGALAILIVRPALGLITTNQAVIDAAVVKVQYIAVPYFLCGLMEVLSYALRGIGKSLISMIICVFGTCVFRIFWIYVILPLHTTIEMLYTVYVISWILTVILLAIGYIISIKKLEREI